jgi:ABC-type antimicrobial peptide transport system permease subunit
LETLPEIALGEDGQKLIAKELLVLITMQKKYSDSIANVIIRGIGKRSFALRPQVKLMTGRMPRWGTSEIVVGQSVAKRFKNSGLQKTLYFAMRSWNIVGVFDAGETGFSSEIWGDADQLMQSFRRQTYSSVIFQLRYNNLFEMLKKDISKDPRLTLSAIREKDYYLKQSETMSTFLRILGISLTLIFSLGAMVGAMITMFAAVANRTAEIGTLRSLGFQRRSILFTFLLESLILGFFGGCAGLVFASFLQLITISTMNFQTFSELAFSFAITPGIIIKSMLFSIIMGFVGGILPALKASRMNIVDSLRQV